MLKQEKNGNKKKEGIKVGVRRNLMEFPPPATNEPYPSPSNKTMIENNNKEEEEIITFRTFETNDEVHSYVLNVPDSV